MKNNSIDSLSIENRENYDKLMAYLMNAALFDYHIGVEFSNKLPPLAPPISYNDPARIIIMNARWIYPTQIPFQLAHEIAHVLHENQHYYHLNEKSANSGEADANIFAINLLKKYCADNGFYFDTYYNFAKCFNIPHSLYYLFDDRRIVQSSDYKPMEI